MGPEDEIFSTEKPAWFQAGWVLSKEFQTAQIIFVPASLVFDHTLQGFEGKSIAGVMT